MNNINRFNTSGENVFSKLHQAALVKRRMDEFSKEQDNKLKRKRVFSWAYVIIMFLLPVIAWIAAFSSPRFHWDTPKILMLSILTIMAWGASLIIHENNINNK